MQTADLTTFLDSTLDAQIAAERALHNGDVTPRLSTWSQRDPVTVFGAGVPFRSGWRDVRAIFDWVASHFESCDDYDYELLAGAAHGDLAYTVGIERYRALTASGTTVDNTLRVTHIYRREAGHWRIVHRHGDHMPADTSATPTHDQTTTNEHLAG
ncbi:MAG: YybH family protein [Acidimicrobiales bacterium]